ncbi:lytic transglycosylase domain-containing protein [Asticcacaulis sp.]|uniref:lytic transglycosylase domain-containing protein n=1 Tax=Asticcacaulis sp. TaxID=1872648 RepID=UPI002BF8C382|nr:lytic transglycosylase domain-containing protein [Asticcacaulis sp.]HTM81578.1 lytic transglycosylase domain-containing protein [Asticcacaulis sp.]
MKRELYLCLLLSSAGFVNCGMAQAPNTEEILDPRLSNFSAYITEASARFDVPVAWIQRVILAESNGQTRVNGQPIRSRVGAIGLMQLMPGTYRDMQLAYGLGDNPDDPHDNILAGTAYLKRMYDSFGYPGLFGAYNAGPVRFADSLLGKPLPEETRLYLTKLTAIVREKPPVPGLFVTSAEGLFITRNRPTVDEN